MLRLLTTKYCYCLLAVFALSFAAYGKDGAKTHCPLVFEQLLMTTAQSIIPTVDFQGINADGKVVFRKRSFGNKWGSRFSYNSAKANTPLGDVRFPIFVLGIDLARKFGFEMSSTPGGFEITAPSADLLKRTIDRLNSVLKEPIAYLPVKSGFLDSSKLLEFSLATTGQYKLFFPYEDNNPQLTPHEVSYHLGSIVLPEFFVNRARAVNEETMRLANYLEKRKGEISQMDEIVSALLKERALDVDAGTGNLVAQLARNRNENALVNYSDMEAGSREYLISTIRSPIYDLLHPRQTEAETAATIARDVIDFDGSRHFVNLVPKDKQKVLQMLNDFLKVPSNVQHFEVPSLEELASQLINSLDKRIETINQAFDKIPH